MDAETVFFKGLSISCRLSRRLRKYRLLFYVSFLINPWAAMWIASQAPPKVGA